MKSFSVMVLLVLLTACGTKDSQGQSGVLQAAFNKSIIKYSSADVLNVRKLPEAASEIVAVLPYGTMVHVVKTEKTSVINGKRDYWWGSSGLNGYIFGAFLQSTVPAANLEMVLHYRESAGDYPSCGFSGSWRRIVLSKGRVSMQYGSMSPALHARDGRAQGIYSYELGILHIQFTSGNMVQEKPVSGHFLEGGRIETNILQIVPEDMRLRWISKINGFVPVDKLELIDNPGFIHHFPSRSLVPVKQFQLMARKEVVHSFIFHGYYYLGAEVKYQLNVYSNDRFTP